jgi:DNA-binding transcriptional LysR family regulator
MRDAAEMRQMVCFELLMNSIHIVGRLPPAENISPMRIDFLGLHAFVAIAERGSFQLAAAHLNLSQTALSHRMRKLEDDLGVRLLSRTTREVSLTPAGLELLPKVRRMIEELSVSLDELRQHGRVRQANLAIGCLPTIAAGHLPDALRKFRSAHPDVVLRIHDNSATEIAELVDSGAIEFGITLVASHRWDFDIETLVREPFMLVCRADHAFAALPAASWSDLETVPLIRISPHTGNRMIIDDALGSRRESLSWRYEVQHVNTAVALVRAGLGMTVIPRLALASAQTGDLHAIHLRNPGVSRQIGIVSKRSAPLSPLAHELRKLIVQDFASRSALHRAS